MDVVYLDGVPYVRTAPLFNATKDEMKAVIRFLYSEGATPEDIVQRMQNQYGDTCLSCSKIYEWIERFQSDRFQIISHRHEITSSGPSTSTSTSTSAPKSKMTAWKPYHKVIDGLAPDLPGVYEIRWDRDIKARYIGMASNLRERLYGHPYQPSDVGNFLVTHMNSRVRPPLVRFKIMTSPAAAREEERKRIRLFERRHGKKPVYNRNS